MRRIILGLIQADEDFGRRHGCRPPPRLRNAWPLGIDHVLFSLRDRFAERYRKLNPGRPVEGETVLAGEWCGSGVQRKIAILKAPKFLAIISVSLNEEWLPDWEYADIHDERNRIYRVGRAGFVRHERRLDDVAGSEAEIKRLTDEEEKECPFAKRICGESGLGEGVVWKAIQHCSDAKFWFKSKGDSLAVSSVQKLTASASDIAKRQWVANVASVVVTKARLEQGWNQLRHKNSGGLGLLLKWLVDDCVVEEKLKMEELGNSKGESSPAIVSIAKR